MPRRFRAVRNLRRRVNYNNRKNNRKDKEQNKKINQLQQEVKSLKITKNKQLGNKNTDFLMPFQKSYNFQNYKNAVETYIKAMMYPEKFLNIGIKLPSPLNTYSFTYGFKEQFDFTPAESGAFNLIWYPNFFAANTAQVGTATVEGTTSLRINGAKYLFSGTKRFLVCNNDQNLREWWAPGNHTMYTPTEGYRLVSASINIRYVGNEINKSGYIMSIPSYRNIPSFASVHSDETPTFITNLIPKIDESVFVNTRGTKSNFTLAPNNVVKRVYIPIDPADQIFEDPGYYYSSAVDSNQSYREFNTKEEAIAAGVIINTTESFIRVLKPEDGNPLKYIFLGKGFRSEVAGSIHVEAYYNFECIPVEGMRTTANPIGGGKDPLTNEEKNIIIDEVAKEELGDTNTRGRFGRIFRNFKNRATRYATNTWNYAKPYVKSYGKYALKTAINHYANKNYVKSDL